MSDKGFFSKELQKKCEYCKHGRALSDNSEVFCKKKGFKEPEDCCHAYRYDPLKREPAVTGISKNYTKEDFVI